MHGAAGAAGRDRAIALGVNVASGSVTNRAVAEALGRPYEEPGAVLLP